MPRRPARKPHPEPALDPPAGRQKVSYSTTEIELLDTRRLAAGYRTRSRYIHDVSLGYRPPTNVLTRQTDAILIELNRLNRQLAALGNNLNQIAKRTNTFNALQMEDAAALSLLTADVLPKLKREVATAAHQIVAMTCPTEQASDDDP